MGFADEAARQHYQQRIATLTTKYQELQPQIDAAWRDLHDLEQRPTLPGDDVSQLFSRRAELDAYVAGLERFASKLVIATLALRREMTDNELEFGA